MTPCLLARSSEDAVGVPHERGERTAVGAPRAVGAKHAVLLAQIVRRDLWNANHVIKRRAVDREQSDRVLCVQ